MKIAHILSDEKFIDRHINKFERSDFHNFYFYLKKSYKYQGNYPHKLLYIQPDLPAYKELVEKIEDYDLVIFYFLQRDKIAFLKDIQASKVVIAWSFYGAELYSLPLLKYSMLSDTTLKTLNWDFLNLGKLEDRLRSIVYFFKNKPTDYQLIKQSIPRINYFLWYNPYEYDFLNNFFNHKLPAFIPYSMTDVMEHVIPNRNKSNSILIGNSRAFYNNHLDAISLLQSANFSGKISIPFSYGNNPRYADKVKKVAASS